MGAFQPRLHAQWGWALVIFGLPWSHAAMSLGTAWVGVCALMFWWQNGWALTLSRKTFASPWLWLTLLLIWASASLAWSDNTRWGLHQLSILASLFILACAWLTVPLKTKRQLTSWVFCSGALAMAGVLVWGAWRTLDGANLAGRDWTPWTSHIRLSMLVALGMVWETINQGHGGWRTWGYGSSSPQLQALYVRLVVAPCSDVVTVGCHKRKGPSTSGRGVSFGFIDLGFCWHAMASTCPTPHVRG